MSADALPWSNNPLDTERPRDTVRSSGDFELICEALATGQLRTARDVKQFAKRFGVTEDDMARLKWSPRTIKRVGEKVQALALYAVADALPFQAELAKKNVQAFRSMSQVATVLPVGGVSLSQTILNDNRISGQTESMQAFAKSFWQRVQESRKGGLQLIESMQHDPPEPTHIPDPTEPGGPVDPEPEPEPTTEA